MAMGEPAGMHRDDPDFNIKSPAIGWVSGGPTSNKPVAGSMSVPIGIFLALILWIMSSVTMTTYSAMSDTAITEGWNNVIERWLYLMMLHPGYSIVIPVVLSVIILMLLLHIKG